MGSEYHTDTVLVPFANETGGDVAAEVNTTGSAPVPEDADVASSPPDELAALDGVDLAAWLFAKESTYSTLYTLLNGTGLTEELSQTDPFTLFAPSNDAFAVLPGVEKYSDPEWSAHLYEILLYHIVPGELDTSSMNVGMNVLTTLGETFNITSAAPTVTINNLSSVVEPDNVASNGLVHGISSVLLPPSAVLNTADIVERSPFFRELLALVVAAGLDDALRGPGRWQLRPNVDL
jgi:Fasciclin domain